MNIARLLQRSASLYPDRPALRVGAQPWLTYGQLGARVAALAAHLRQQGIGPGDRVALYAANVREYLEAPHAVYWAGAVTVPVNYKLHARELEYVLHDSGAALLLVSPELAPAATPVAPPGTQVLVLGAPAYEQAMHQPPLPVQERAPDDLASLFYTSGTTGRPKGVMQTHRNLLAMTACYFTDVDDVEARDAMVYAAPMSHGAGLYNFAHILRGAQHVVPASGGFEPAELLDLAQRVGRLVLFAAPTMVKRLVDHVVDAGGPDSVPAVSGFKTIIYGGGPMYVDDLQRALATLGPCLVQIYGQGESPMTITALARDHLLDRAHPRWLERIASVGVAQSLVEVRVVDAAGTPLPVGEVGEVVVRGETVMPGYWNNPEASAQALQGGWLHTGDTGSLDADGFLTLKDRSKDLVISGGSNIYPREVEEVLLAHPAVSEVAVIGQPDAEWGEVPVAFVVARAGAAPDSAALDAWCLAQMARFKRPRHYHWVAALPKNSYGKVLKTALRAGLANAQDS